MPYSDDPKPRRDPWWVLALGLVILVLVLWLLLERTNSPAAGALREGRGSSLGGGGSRYCSDIAARRAISRTGPG